ncbi:MAG: YifB family Mg chelatase-like AAA ATPase [Mogibacterium sp.]|nr:YifB family Mg chelatase-like AAA ATPase [Mogibacterium sp.]
MYSRIKSAVCLGIEGKEVLVETDISKGLPSISVVGLAQATVMESKDRIKSAIINSGFDYPRTRITINLMPADLKKNSSSLDLPIAMGMLASQRDSGIELGSDTAMIGELTLDGGVSAVKGALPMLLCLKKEGVKKAFVPVGNLEEARIAGINEIFPVESLREAAEAVSMPEGAVKISGKNGAAQTWQEHGRDCYGSSDMDFGDICGQENAKRAALVAAAGRHGLLMVGSPGCGKTMLAGRIPSIMPAMSSEELIQAAVIRSISGIGYGNSVRDNENDGMKSRLFSPIRPFRHPHHTIGPAGLLGGGSNIAMPGEITLAHNGVLFLDEICEFNRHVIDGLRIPLEEKSITHFRRGEAYTYPCDFQLVMASNPCPCGYYGDKERECKCSQADIDRYQNKLSGPIMDRIDMKISMERVTYKQLTSEGRGMNSSQMKEAVYKALEFGKSMGRKGYNSELTTAEAERHSKLGREEKAFMREAYNAFAMSPRAYMRMLRVARTIADLDESEKIKQEHLAEALSYRMS